jgi:hypothetical protein
MLFRYFEPSTVGWVELPSWAISSDPEKQANIAGYKQNSIRKYAASLKVKGMMFKQVSL